MRLEVLIERPTVTVEFEGEVIEAPNLVVVRAGARLGLGCGQCILHRRLLTNGELQIFRSKCGNDPALGENTERNCSLNGPFYSTRKARWLPQETIFSQREPGFWRKNPQAVTFLPQFK